jgi:AcrR family transcriptional regulator
MLPSADQDQLSRSTRFHTGWTQSSPYATTPREEAKPNWPPWRRRPNLRSDRAKPESSAANLIAVARIYSVTPECPLMSHDSYLFSRCSTFFHRAASKEKGLRVQAWRFSNLMQLTSYRPVSNILESSASLERQQEALMARSVPIKSIPRTGADSNRTENVRRIVYERALDLFETKGFRATSMNEIATACGVSKPAIYHYFRNKSHLLETLYEDVTAEFFGTMQRLARSSGDAAERLRTLVEQQTLYNIENRRFLTIFWRERHEFDPLSRKSLAARERDFEAWVKHIVEEGQATGKFHTEDAQVATLAILGLLSTVHRWAGHAGTSPKQIARAVGALVLDGVCVTRDQAAPKKSQRTSPKMSRVETSQEERPDEQNDAGGQARPHHRRR